jgi:hypothetical protein
MTPAVDQWPAAARLVAVAAAGHSDPLLLHHLKGHDRGELSSAGATAGAQGAAIQVASLRAALPEYACRRLQYLQSSTPSRLPIHAAKIPNRCCRAMEKRCHSRMMLGQFWLSMRTSFVAVTKPARGLAPKGLSFSTMLGKISWVCPKGAATSLPARMETQTWAILTAVSSGTS